MSAKSESPKAKMTDYFSKTPIRSNSLNRIEKRIRSPDDEDIFEKKHKSDNTIFEMLQALSDKFDTESIRQEKQNIIPEGAVPCPGRRRPTTR